MDKSSMLLSFLQKNCNVAEPIPSAENEKFDFYKRWVNKLPKECINESFLKIEDGFLSEVIKERQITAIENQSENISLQVGQVVDFKADAALCFLNEGNDKTAYLYGGTRLKSAVAIAVKGKETAVTKANNIYYKGVISAVLPKIDLKLTSVILKGITDKYMFALDIANEGNLKSMLLCLPNVENTLLCSRVADAVIAALKQHKYIKNLKLVLLAPTHTVLGVYQSKIEGLK